MRYLVLFIGLLLFGFDNYRVNIDIDSNKWHIDEKFHHSFNGKVWKNIPISYKEKIKNIKVYIDNKKVKYRTLKKDKIFIIEFFAKGEHNFHIEYDFISYENPITLVPIWWREKAQDIVINIKAKKVKNIKVISKPPANIEKIGNNYLITLDKLTSYNLQIEITPAFDIYNYTGYILLLLYICIAMILYFAQFYSKKIVTNPPFPPIDTGFIYHKKLTVMDVVIYHITSMKEVDLNLIKNLEKELTEKYKFNKTFFYLSLLFIIPLYFYTLIHSDIENIVISIILFFSIRVEFFEPSIKFAFDNFITVVIFFTIVLFSIDINLQSNIYPITFMLTLTFLFKDYISLFDKNLQKVVAYKNYLKKLDFNDLKQLYEKDNTILDKIFPYILIFKLKHLLKIYEDMNYIIPTCNKPIKCIEELKNKITPLFREKEKEEKLSQL
jgi:hypothetical protein